MNKKFVFLVGQFLIAMPLCAMEQQKPLTLFQRFGIGEGTPKGVQNMIAARIVGPGGWWYKKLTLPHNRCVKSIAFHPEGKMIGTAACGDHNAYLWDCEGNQLRTLTHDDSVRGIAFHPKGIMIGTACDDHNAYLWDEDGNKLRKLPHNRWVWGIAFHPEGKMIGTACADHNAYLWDCEGNLLRRLPHNDEVYGIAFHPDGKMIGTVCFLNRNAYLWDCEGKKLKMLPHNCCVNGIAFHPMGKIIGTVCDGRNAYLWDCKGKELRRLPPHEGRVRGIAFHPDGTMIGTACCNDGNAYLWQCYAQPTLQQVLFRQVLKNYFKKCIAGKQKPDNFAVEGANFRQKIQRRLFGAKSIASKTLVPWMARKFNLDKTELNEVWQSFPPIMREAIARTVLYRAGALGKR